MSTVLCGLHETMYCYEVYTSTFLCGLYETVLLASLCQHRSVWLVQNYVLLGSLSMPAWFCVADVYETMYC